MEPCDPCEGKGVLPHEKRKMPNGEDDPADFKTHDLCEECGGSGKIPVDKTRIKESGNIADMAGFMLSPSKGFWR